MVGAVLVVSRRTLVLMLGITGLLGAPQAARADGQTFVVDTVVDDNSAARQACTADPDDCSLRGALSRANADAGSTDTVVLPAGTYALTVAGLEEANAAGDLNVLANVTITGAGADLTTITTALADHLLVVAGSATVTVSGVRFDGGLQAIVNGGTLTLSDSTVVNARSTRFGAYGAGIANIAQMTVQRCLFMNNWATCDGCGGGGIFNSGTLAVSGSTFRANVAERRGSAVYGIGNTTITDSTFMDHTSANMISTSGSMALSGCTIASNHDGLSAMGGTVTVTNSTFTGNGTALVTIGGSVSLKFVTMGGNGESMRLYGGSVSLLGVILVSNPGQSACTRYDGTVASLGYNVLGTGSNTNCSLGGPLDVTGVADAGLDPLADNGGPTQTMAVQPWSPAVGLVPAASCDVQVDQRGSPRGNYACWAGAFQALARDMVVDIQVQPATPAPEAGDTVGFLVSVTDQDEAPGVPFTVTLALPPLLLDPVVGTLAGVVATPQAGDRWVWEGYVPNHATDTVSISGTLPADAASGTTGTATITLASAVIGCASCSASATFTVTNVPRPAPDAFTVLADTTLVVPGPGLLLNDRVAGGETLAAAVETAPLHGSADVGPDGHLTYVPNLGFTGTDTFTYRATATAASATAEVTVDVVPDAPVIAEGSAVRVVMSQDGDPLPFSLTLHVHEWGAAQYTWSLEEAASHGTATATGTGTSLVVGYVPVAHYLGTDAFTVAVTDGRGKKSTTRVDVEIIAGRGECAIQSVSYLGGADNPANECQHCSPSQTRDSWTNHVAGHPCNDDGNPATDDTCDGLGHCLHPDNGTCTIQGQVYRRGSLNPANECQQCWPETDSAAWTNLGAGYPCDDDGDPATTNLCDGTGECRHEAGGRCVIDGRGYLGGDPEPGNACQECAPRSAVSAWSPRVPGYPCADDGDMATLDVCDGAGRCVHPATGTCRIQGVSYLGGAADPANACRQCSPSVDTAGWTDRSAGYPCADDGDLSTLDACDGMGHCEHPASGACAVDGTTYAGGVANPDNACQQCSPGVSAVAWTDRISGYPCADDGDPATRDECDGDGQCVHVPSGACFIGGTAYVGGAADPANACQQCSPSASTTGWTARVAGYPCADEGDPTTADACDGAGRCVHVASGTCVIGGTAYVGGVANPANACQQCSPDSSATQWSNRVRGHPCADDGNAATLDHCDGAGACIHPASGLCVINGTAYVGGSLSPANPCLRCDPVADPAGWSSQAEGYPCAHDDLACTLDACDGQGACAHRLITGCLVGGACVREGEADPQDACRICISTVDAHAYTKRAGCGVTAPDAGALAADASVTGPDTGVPGEDEGDGDASDGCACSASGDGGWWVLGVLLLALSRRRSARA